MTVYAAEINGRAIAAFNAENEIQAEVRATSKAFRADLAVLENEGHPLWNGMDEICGKPSGNGFEVLSLTDFRNRLSKLVHLRCPGGISHGADGFSLPKLMSRPISALLLPMRRRERRCGNRAAEQRDELAALQCQRLPCFGPKG